MLKVYLCLGMVALALHLAAATHPGVAGQVYEHTTAATTAEPVAPIEPTREPKILTENGNLALRDSPTRSR